MENLGTDSNSCGGHERENSNARASVQRGDFATVDFATITPLRARAPLDGFHVATKACKSEIRMTRVSVSGGM